MHLAHFLQNVFWTRQDGQFIPETCTLSLTLPCLSASRQPHSNKTTDFDILLSPNEHYYLTKASHACEASSEGPLPSISDKYV